MRRRQDEEPTPEEKEPKPGWRRVLQQLLFQFRDELVLLAFGTAYAIAQAMVFQVKSGETGLRFDFGRAKKELAPGTHPMMPFVQRARKMPTRSRTLDLPFQRVVNLEGLVMHVDANVVYRITDVRKAMIEIDQLEKGMLQMLGLGVQEVLRATPYEEIQRATDLDRRLATNLALRLAPWGVEIERAGFPSISPSPQSLRITQLRHRVEERCGVCDNLVKAGVHGRRALPLVGTRQVPRRKFYQLRLLDQRRRRERHLVALAKRGGWTGVEIKRASLSLRARMSVRGRSRARNRF
ncbi:MAG: SPFH domain-containing protein [Planctomycetota bacterium]|nr:SPFH domain-containing protein [Planctomycetota bacterium]